MGAAGAGRGKRANKPILLSVGYAACHWCHVMAHESFEDEATAAVMNELFVNIKVDREERPDIDQIYMAALHLLGEQGGWPLTMFLTPDGEPFWGGTYFPKRRRFGRPAFIDVLREVARLFREEPDKIEQNRAALLARLAEGAAAPGNGDDRPAGLDARASQLGNMFDPVNGGMRGAPKFPQPALLELLWRAGLRTGDARFATRSTLTLDTHVRGRHLRSSRRRLRALLHRRALAGAAFREDALRQRAAPRAADAWLSGDRRSAVPRARARDRRLARARDERRRRAPSPPRSTPIRKARRASSTSGRSRDRGCWGRRGHVLRRAYDVTPRATGKATLSSIVSSRTTAHADDRG